MDTMDPDQSDENADEVAADVAGAPGGRTALYVAIGVGVVVVLLVGLLATRKSGSRQAQSPLIGELVPEVILETIDGDIYDIDDRRGEWVAVNFFASWCAACRIEHPELVEFSERHAADGDASIVSIAFDDDELDARKFFEELGGDWPVITTDTGRTAIEFGVIAIPETYLVAPDGTVAAKWVGGITADALDGAIETLTAPTDPAPVGGGGS